MKVAIIGGTGFIGRHLVRSLTQEGYRVTVLTRQAHRATHRPDGNMTVASWDPQNWGSLEKTFVGQDAVINLAGAPIAASRWTKRRKQILQDSRIATTRFVVNALANVTTRPGILINASGIGYYGPRDWVSVNESSPPGHDFLACLCMDWEQEARRAEEVGVRVVNLRLGMVLGKDGGALSKMLLPFRLFLGGPILPGCQPISWIHIEDVTRLVLWVLHAESIRGPVNAVSPNAVSMKQFCQMLGRVLGRPSWLPVPGWVLHLALGELATVMTTGQNVEPKVALSHGFDYSYPTLEAALRSILTSQGVD